MSFPTLHSENKALNLLESASTLYPTFRPELHDWIRQLSAAIARPVAAPEGLKDLQNGAAQDASSLEHETYLLAQALCRYRKRVYPDGLANPQDPTGDARDDLESAMSRFEERLARAKPKVELEHEPDAGDYYTGEDPASARES